MKLKPQDLRRMQDEELAGKINELNSELFKLRFQAKTGRLDKSHRISLAKKDIARIKTIINERKNGDAKK